MPQLIFDAQQYELTEKETVLDCLLRHGVTIPNSCRSGLCQSCLMQAVDGQPPINSQKGLKPALQEQGYFLPCSCHPTEDLAIVMPGEGAVPRVPAVIRFKERLNNTIVRIILQCLDSTFDYRSGQYIHLHREDGLQRCYSLASVPELDDGLELHVKQVPGGEMSSWLFETADVGDQLEIGGPLGECYYQPENQDQPMLLIGTGSGLAPLWGVIRDALSRGHRAGIRLYHGAVDEQGLYLVDEIRQWVSRHPNLEYTPCVLRGSAENGFYEGNINEIALSHNPELKGWKVYLCGDPGLVKAAKRQVFLAGAGLQDILSDPFIIGHQDS